MPVGMIRWSTGGVEEVVVAARRHLAKHLVREHFCSGLPTYMVNALQQAGFDFTLEDLQIDLGAFDPDAHNVSTFEVAVNLSSNDGEPHASREKVLLWLASGVLSWLQWASTAPELEHVCAVARVQTLDVDLRYDGQMAGLTINVETCIVTAAWGDLGNLVDRCVM